MPYVPINSTLELLREAYPRTFSIVKDHHWPAIYGRSFPSRPNFIDLFYIFHHIFGFLSFLNSCSCDGSMSISCVFHDILSCVRDKFCHCCRDFFCLRCRSFYNCESSDPVSVEILTTSSISRMRPCRQQHSWQPARGPKYVDMQLFSTTAFINVTSMPNHFGDHLVCRNSLSTCMYCMWNTPCYLTRNNVGCDKPTCAVCTLWLNVFPEIAYSSELSYVTDRDFSYSCVHLFEPWLCALCSHLELVMPGEKYGVVGEEPHEGDCASDEPIAVSSVAIVAPVDRNCDPGSTERHSAPSSDSSPVEASLCGEYASSSNHHAE